MKKIIQYVRHVVLTIIAKISSMNNDMTYCTGKGCKVAHKCKRFILEPSDSIYVINPPTRVHCATKEPIPINGCELFISDNDGFSKVIENDIGV